MSDQSETWSHILDFISERRSKHSCPRCNQNDWLPAGPFSLDIQSFDGAFGRGAVRFASGPAVPMAAVICRNCAHVEFIGIGVIPGLGYE